LDGWCIILNADLGLEREELPNSSRDGGRGMYERIALKGCPRDGTLLGPKALPVAEFAERRVAVPQPAIGILRQGGVVVA